MSIFNNRIPPHDLDPEPYEHEENCSCEDCNAERLNVADAQENEPADEYLQKRARDLYRNAPKRANRTLEGHV